MTHQDLIKVAQRWLTNTAHCAVVLTELSTSAGEIPDAIGWYGRNSILVECKISRGDFFADKDKPSRRAERVLGGKRFYLTPKGLVEPEEVPEGWGLLEVYSEAPALVRVKKNCEWPLERNLDSCLGEISMLVSALRRIKQREFICIVPETVKEKRSSAN